MPKSYEKICHNKSKKKLTKEGMISFWRLGKTIRTKARKVWQRRAQFPFVDSVSKAGKSIKLSRIKSTTL